MQRRSVLAGPCLAVILIATDLRADSTVVFNEIHYHPLGNAPDLEWVELHNQMAVDMDISGWYLDAGVYFEFAEGSIVPGGGFVVIASSPERLAELTGFAGALGPFIGRIDNSGEALELRSSNGRLMDRVRYRSSGDWPVEPDGSGTSLAKAHPDLGSGPAASWRSSDEVGGTPGEHNFDLPGKPGALPPDVISYWDFDQASGRLIDRQTGNHGTMGTGGARVAGVIGSGAVELNNTATAYISVGSGVGNSFSVTKGIAIEAIIRPAWSGAEGDADTIFRKDDGLRRILLGFQNDGQNGAASPPVPPGPVLSFGLMTGAAYEELDMPLDGLEGRPSLASLGDGKAHHVAATYDSATGLKAIYIDGVLAFSAALPAGSAISSGGTTAAYIGNTNGRAEPFTGVIDEAAVWKRGLTPEEVADHHRRVSEGKSYFEAEPDPPGPAKPRLAFDEVFSSPRDPAASFVELLNLGPEAVELADHIIVASGVAAAEHVLAAETIAPGGRRVLAAPELGFEFLPGDKLFLLSPDRSAVLASAPIEAGARARLPEGTGTWLSPDVTTPGAPGSFRLHEEIVINEIFYHPRPEPGRIDPEDSSETWIELFNRGGIAVDLTGWRLEGGIRYVFAGGTLLAPGEYLVVAADSERLQALHPGLRIAGDIQGRLSRRSDLLLLLDADGNPADEVRYQDGGRWPDHADGGGSSLELRDPRADNSVPEAWAASDESAKSGWKVYSHRAVAAAGIGPTRWNEFIIGLLDGGECLIDDVSVVESPGDTAREVIQNGSFDAGSGKWRLLGNHGRSQAAADPEDPAGKVLHLVATGPTEHMHNHAETTLAGGARVTPGKEYLVSFAAKWLAGSNALNTRLYFNRVPVTTRLEVPALAGTPGARNSRLEENIGPTFRGFGHSPPVPRPTDPVTVRAVPGDPDGVAASVLHYSVNGGGWVEAAMTPGEEGAWLGTVPPQAAGAVVQFFVEAADGRGAAASFPAKGPASRALYKVDDGQALLARVHNVRIIMTAADTNLLHQETNVMSNERLGATIVYDETEVFYEAGIRLKGSERGRPVSERVGFNIKLQPDHLFRGVHESIQIDRSGGWKFGRMFGQDEIVIKHIAAHAGGIPCMYDDIIRVIAPRPAQTGSALLIMAGYGDEFLDSQFENGGDGTAYELELIYYPTSTVDGSPEGLKRPQPDEVLGVDFRDLGNDQEVYRWNFLIENNRGRDDYAPLIALCKAFSLPAATLHAGTRAAMDVDQWMRAFAIYSLCGIGDAYTQGNNHNLVVYERPSDGRMLAFPWDLDFAFTQATNAPLWGDQGLSRIIQLPPNRRLYYGHLLDIMSSTYDTAYMSRWISHYGGLCGQDFSSIVPYIQQRRASVTQAIPARVPFAITTQGGQDFSVDARTVLIEGNAWFDVREIYLEGNAEPIEPSWPTPTRWQATVDIVPGPNLLRFLAVGARGEALAMAGITVTSLSDPPPFLRGDADLDGILGLTDAVTVLVYLYQGGTLRCEDAGDADDNELLDITDPIYVLNHLFRGGPPPPPPQDAPGTEPADEGPLQCAEGLGPPN